MGLVYYLKDAAGCAGSFSLPSNETISLLKALYFKKEAFRRRAKHIIACDEITEESDENKNNSVILHLESKSYACDEYTYFNSFLYDFSKLDYYEHDKFEIKHKNLSLEDYKAYSRPLKRNPIGTEQNDSERDTGHHNGYRGYKLNFYGCLLKLIKDLPEYTLIECKKKMNNSLLDLFGYLGDEKPEFHMNITRYYISGYPEAEEYETFTQIAEEIMQLCIEKNIYFDINPYSEIIMFKEPIETWINTQNTYSEKNVRHSYIKYEDTYFDGHVDYHEESAPIEIVNRTLISRKSTWMSRKCSKIYETYDVTYSDGVSGQITKEYNEYD